jgi:hypothetical protein
MSAPVVLRLAPAGSAPGTEPSAVHQRAQQPLLRTYWSLDAVAATFPWRWPSPAATPPSPKPRYRSQYQWPGPPPLQDPARLATLSDFELALHLIDFAPLEPVLATMYRPSRKGQVPFHPVSLFLACALRRELDLSWRALARLLAGEHGAGWRALCGFQAGGTPSASGLRYFFHALGGVVFEQLCPDFVTLLRQEGRFPERSPYPGDPPTQGITVTQDGMLHRARHHPRCVWTTDSCYEPLPPPRPAAPLPAAGMPAPPPAAAAGRPGLVGRRPCSAPATGHTGCLCLGPACQPQCARASPHDREARLIHYAGPTAREPGTTVFGYRSVAERALDDRFAIAWTLRSGLYPANADERTLFDARGDGLQQAFPTLRIGEWLDDAGVGYGECLARIWQLGAFRLVAIRADPTDADPLACLRRGYDGHGRPLCPHGYPLRANGYDYARRRAKYCCAQVCRRMPLPPGLPAQPVAACPYRDPAHPSGFVVNVGRTLPDGSLRLAREIPYDSPRWRARYGRRNLAESRNAQVEGLGLKRLPNYGLARNAKDVQLADWLINLHTLGRLVRQATCGPGG